MKTKTQTSTQQTKRSSWRPATSAGSRTQKRPLLMRLLFHPMFYLAILAHGLLLAVPGGPEEEVPPEIEAEIEEIEITMLPAIVEPDPEIPVEELPPEPPPAPVPDPVPPPAEPIPQQEPLVVESSEPEVEEEPEVDETDESEEDNEDGDGDQQPVNTSADLSQVANLVDGIVVQINQTREPTLQIEATDAPTRTNFYRNPENYFVDAESKSGEFKPGILQNTENARLLVSLDDTNAEELSLQVQNFLGVVFDVADVSEKLPAHNESRPSNNDILLALSAKGETTVRLYLALARMKGNSAVVIPWASDSFSDGSIPE